MNFKTFIKNKYPVLTTILDINFKIVLILTLIELLAIIVHPNIIKPLGIIILLIVSFNLSLQLILWYKFKK
jgi:hypothetical protein